MTAEQLFYWPYLMNPSMKNIAFIGAEHLAIHRAIPDSIDVTFIYPQTNWHELVDSRYVPSQNMIIERDPIGYLKDSDIKYDALIINRGSLVSLSDKRFETEYFIELCRESIKHDGILCFNIESYHGSWRNDLKTRLGNIYSFLQSHFNQVEIIPGDNLIFIAGNDIKLVSDGLIAKHKSLSIVSDFFNESFIRAKLNQFNLNKTRDELKDYEIKSNPYEIGYGLSYYFSKSGISWGMIDSVNYILLLIIIIISITLSGTLNKFKVTDSVASFNVLYFGLSALAIELVAMYKIQLIGGYLYMILGVMIGLFMIGMSLGSYLGSRLMKSSNLPTSVIKWLNIALGILILLSLVVCVFESNQVILLIIIGLAGFCGGLGYAVASYRADIHPGIPYSVDLLGGIIGTLIGLGILIGGLNMGYVFAGIAALGAILLATNKLLLKY
jgi:hypothetical protein